LVNLVFFNSKPVWRIWPAFISMLHFYFYFKRKTVPNMIQSTINWNLSKIRNKLNEYV
jgi:hypothetical protein